MTYCLAIAVNAGLLLVSDSRTGAGVEDVSSDNATRTDSWKGGHVFKLPSASNVATARSVDKQVERDAWSGSQELRLRTVPGVAAAVDHIRVARPESAIIDHQGNCVSMFAEFPFLPVGETKIGMPIRDRFVAPCSALAGAAL